MVYPHIKKYRFFTRKPSLVILLMTYALLSPIGSSYALPNSLYDQALSEMSIEDLMSLEVTTPSRASENIRSTTATTDVILAEDIRRWGSRDLFDVLRHIPGLGVELDRFGRMRLEDRGVSSTRFESTDKILFLLNGMPLLNNPYFGGPILTSLSYVPLANITRIEFVHGPGSTMYGSSALLGTINIITAEPSSESTKLSTSAATEWEDNLRGWKLNAFTNVPLTKKESLNLNLYAYDSDGFDSFVREDSRGKSGEVETGAKDYDIQTSAKGDNWYFNLRSAWSTRDSAFGIAHAIDPNGLMHYHGTSAQFYYLYENGDLVLKPRTYLNYLRPREIFASGLYYGPSQRALLSQVELRNLTFGEDLQATITTSQSTRLVTGVFVEHQRQFNFRVLSNSFDVFPDISQELLPDIMDTGPEKLINGSHNRLLSGAYAEGLWEAFTDFNLSTGLRYDWYEHSTADFSPQASFSYNIAKYLYLKGRVSSAFRAPDFVSLYTKNNPTRVGNPDLESERIVTSEISAGGSLIDIIGYEITLFRSRLSDLIGTQASPIPNNPDQIVNATSANFHGAHGSIHIQHPLDGSLDFGFSLNDVSLDNASNISQHFSPRWRTLAGLTQMIGEDVNLYLEWDYRSRTRRRDNDPRPPFASRSIFNSSILFQDIFGPVDLRTSVYNLLNSSVYSPSPAFTLADDFPLPGRTLAVELRGDLKFP